MNHYLEEFCRTTEELLGSDAVRMMGRWKHHGHISTLDHSLFVAYCSYRAARALRLDETAAARAGLLHDLYLYDSRDASAHPGWQWRTGCPPGPPARPPRSGEAGRPRATYGTG